MTLPRPWLLVFDLDGTLIDSSLDLCLAVNASMTHVGAPALPHEVITGYIGDGAAMLVRRALGDPDTPNQPDNPDNPHTRPARHPDPQHRFERAFAFFLEFYREHKLDHTRLYDGALAALQTIRKQHQDLPMAVLTNKPVRPSQEICDALHIASFFFAIYGGNTFASKKPDPTGLLLLMQQARQLWQARGIAPEHLPPGGAVMIGDSAVDVLTAQRAQARSLGCRYGLSPHALELATPDLLCDSPAQWPAALAHFSTSA